MLPSVDTPRRDQSGQGVIWSPVDWVVTLSETSRTTSDLERSCDSGTQFNLPVPVEPDSLNSPGIVSICSCRHQRRGPVVGRSPRASRAPAISTVIGWLAQQEAEECRP
jgi:hypothetical protein